MPLSKIKTKKQPGTRPVYQHYVFFCEGADEVNMVKTIQSGDYIIQPVNAHASGQYIFTPAKVLKDCLNTALNQETKIRLLVDTDVFFKSVNHDWNYTNLTPADNKILADNRLDSDDRKKLLQRFESQQIKNQDYKFLEQELTFEDFVVLFFVGEDVGNEYDEQYLKWFQDRFGDTTNSNMRQYNATGDLSNQHTNGIILKTALVKLLIEYDRQNSIHEIAQRIRIQETSQPLAYVLDTQSDWQNPARTKNLISNWVDEWLNTIGTGQDRDKQKQARVCALATLISDWVVYRTKHVTLENRISIATNRITFNRNRGWPTRFGIIDFLQDNMQRQEDKNER